MNSPRLRISSTIYIPIKPTGERRTLTEQDVRGSRWPDIAGRRVRLAVYAIGDYEMGAANLLARRLVEGGAAEVELAVSSWSAAGERLREDIAQAAEAAAWLMENDYPAPPRRLR